ncbi:FecR domain-containing protein [Reyranella sp.]|uniref:FecR family protein n=1 Tax=Reyranella sp. TaxID=1929291 RepID=UPI0026009F92|nr:FecR domain-containing protein [Reyranella sp.]
MTTSTPGRDLIRQAKAQKRLARDLSRPSRSRRWGVVGVSLLAVLVLSFCAPSLVKNFGVDHVTTTAEHRNVDLPDGSLVELGAASALDVQFSATDRRLKLRSGEAFFKVKSGDARPFIVKAGGVSVVVTGTAFNVRLADEAVSVAVEDGSVEVRMPSPETGQGVRGPVLRRLQAGEQLVARADGTIEQGPVNDSGAGSWRRHRLNADGSTVGDAIDRLRRYHGGWIVVTDGNLLRQRFTGFYDLRDPVGSLRAVVAPFGAQVRPISTLIIVSVP